MPELVGGAWPAMLTKPPINRLQRKANRFVRQLSAAQDLLSEIHGPVSEPDQCYVCALLSAIDAFWEATA